MISSCAPCSEAGDLNKWMKDYHKANPVKLHNEFVQSEMQRMTIKIKTLHDNCIGDCGCQHMIGDRVAATFEAGPESR
jgi:hypothetical protein